MTEPPPVEEQPDLTSYLQPLKISDSRLYDLACSFSTVFQNLASSCDDGLFCPVPVTYLPGGHENGRYLAVDVGITTLRVAFIELLGESSNAQPVGNGKAEKSRNVMRKAQLPRVRRTLEKAWRIEERLKEDQPHELFLWIGNCIAEVVKDDLLSSSSGGDSPPYIETGIAFGLPIK
jgi:hexokinase